MKLSQTQQVQHLPPALTEEFKLQLRPETVLGVRWNREIAGNEWLVKWKKLLNSEATWGSVYLMNQQFPSFHLENKVQRADRLRSLNILPPDYSSSVSSTLAFYSFPFSSH
ncbi:Cleavage stimulation factor subunit 1 [Cucumis melo var. makuwa]|uniref:Cleavage stimulation factor subunit 1 n=1 Tax=Cucumis melo var. makuwa TaxID=1194695 RepID=A0A5D3E0X1_CUCMM|nr:Cleavage stimulation factor subunit 1 [Cucumis melo var. makuwa]TYK29160.1 Cleavage stimulation factor subunit 1 [Cucumis melo var. makuwa]